MKHMIQKMYALNGKPGDRKKLKRQPTNPSEDTMDMTDISQNSLLCGMKEFDKAVQNMDETILVPSRLMDMSVSDESGKSKQHVPSLLQSSEAYDVYRLVKSVRAQVRRGAVDTTPADLSQGLGRSESTLSSQSLNSLASEASSAGGVDSGLDEADAEAADDRCQHMHAEFSSHLSGLAKCLAQMTDAATYLSGRYEQQLNTGF